MDDRNHTVYSEQLQNVILTPLLFLILESLMVVSVCVRMLLTVQGRGDLVGTVVVMLKALGKVDLRRAMVRSVEISKRGKRQETKVCPRVGHRTVLS